MTWQKDLSIGRYGSKMRARVDLVSQNLSANRSYIRVRIYAYNGGYSRTYNVGTGALVAVSGTVDRSERGPVLLRERLGRSFRSVSFRVVVEEERKWGDS